MKYIIATHGTLAKGYLETLRMFVNEENIYAICAYSIKGDNVENDLNDITCSFLKDEQIIVFTDLFGGSVTQKMIKYFDGWNSKIYAGINLPFILEVILRGEDINSIEIDGIINEAKNQLIDVLAALNN